MIGSCIWNKSKERVQEETKNAASLVGPTGKQSRGKEKQELKILKEKAPY